MNLEDLSLKELRNLKTKVERAISSFEDRKRKEALAAAEDAVRKLGYSSLAELTGEPKSRRSLGKVAPKYAHPENPDMTWTGRGRRPRWVQDHVDSGKKLEDLEI